MYGFNLAIEQSFPVHLSLVIQILTTINICILQLNCIQILDFRIPPERVYVLSVAIITDFETKT